MEYPQYLQRLGLIVEQSADIDLCACDNGKDRVVMLWVYVGVELDVVDFCCFCCQIM